MTPFSCPVSTFSCALDSNRKASPCSGSSSCPTIGNFSSYSSAISRRLAASARANSAKPAVSASLGRSTVSAHDVHKPPGLSTRISQLHSARLRLPHSWYSSASTKPAWSLSPPLAITSRAISGRENPSALPHDRQVEFSKVRRWPQLGQWKSRMQLVVLVRHDVDGDVEHAFLGIGVDDAAQRRHVGVVAAPPDDDVP